ncbi:MAG: efflux RND transporter periplasmic adaptor subunit [Thermodesulfovibrionales bacterium]
MKTRRGRAVVVLAAAAALALAGCGEGPAKKEAERPVAAGVTVEAVAPSAVVDYYEAQGTVRTRTRSVVSARLMAEIKAVHVKEGERVRKGQALASLDDRDVRARAAAADEALKEAKSLLASAESRRELARATYARHEGLFREKALTAQELDAVRTELQVAEQAAAQAEAAVGRAEAALREAGVHLGFAEVSSPVDGVVAEKAAEPGSMAVPGQPLFVIDEAAYRMEAAVDEGMVGAVKEGMEVEVSIPALARTMAGRVARVAPAVEPASRTFLVKIDLKDGSLRSGLYGKARFPVGVREALVVPAQAVVEKGQLTGVYLVGEGGVISYRLIRTGKSHPQGLEVLSGLAAGDRIITAGVANAVDGGVAAEAR